ncbi:hypothetical protein CerSpe_205890 [Prunus speciosa]
MIWRIGKGDTVQFWNDRWISDIPLIQYEGIVRPAQPDCTVSELMKDDWWDVDKLRTMLSEDLVQKIVSYPIGFGTNLRDVHIWDSTSNGVFTVKFAYDLLFRDDGRSDPFWDVLWKIKVPPKLKVFFWLAYQDKVLTNEQRTKRNLTTDPSCSLYGWHSESVLHLFRECSNAKKVWDAVCTPRQLSNLSTTNMQIWFMGNLCSKATWGAGLPWPSVFLFTCWFIWKWRNHYIFTDKKELPPYPQRIILHAINDWVDSFIAPSGKKPKVLISLAWELPTIGLFKLNIDGSRKTLFGAAGEVGSSLTLWETGRVVSL